MNRSVESKSQKSDSSAQPPTRIYVLIENPKKSNNLGPILRCCAAFAVAQVVLVGFASCATDGSQGAAKHVPIVAFPTLLQAVEYLRAPVKEGGCECQSIVGLLGGCGHSKAQNGNKVVLNEKTGVAEVGEGADPLYFRKSFAVQERPFGDNLKNMTLIINKSGKGLPIALARKCDYFVHVPHARVEYLGKPVMLLDGPSYLSITLHHMTAWANYSQRASEGYKFDLQSFQRGGEGDPTIGDSFGRSREQSVAERKEKRSQSTTAATSILDEGIMQSLFDASVSADY